MGRMVPSLGVYRRETTLSLQAVEWMLREAIQIGICEDGNWSYRRKSELENV